MENSVFFPHFSMGSVDLINSSTQVKPGVFELSLGFSAGVSRGTFLWNILSRARAEQRCFGNDLAPKRSTA